MALDARAEMEFYLAITSSPTPPPPAHPTPPLSASSSPSSCYPPTSSPSSCYPPTPSISSCYPPTPSWGCSPPLPPPPPPPSPPSRGQAGTRAGTTAWHLPTPARGASRFSLDSAATAVGSLPARSLKKGRRRRYASFDALRAVVKLGEAREDDGSESSEEHPGEEKVREIPPLRPASGAAQLADALKEFFNEKSTEKVEERGEMEVGGGVRASSFGNASEATLSVCEREEPMCVARVLFILGFVCPLAWLFASFALLRRRRAWSSDVEGSVKSSSEAITEEKAREAEARWARRCFIAWTVLCVLVGAGALIAALVARIRRGWNH